MRLLQFIWAALTLLFIASTISLYHRNSLGLTRPVIPFPKSVNLTIIPHIVNCSASRQSDDSRQPKFVVVLKTRIEEVEQRKAIRETWASQLRCPVVFAVGKSLHSANNSKIINESSIYGDILQADFIDSYFNLTLKSLSILQWMDEHSAQVDFFVQGDSDMLMSPKRLEHFMSARRYREKEIYGHLYEWGIVHHSDKWVINPTTYPYMYYPEYCSGRVFFHHSGYISVDDAYLTGIIALASIRLKTFLMNKVNFYHSTNGLFTLI
ncbi:Galactosyl T domain containing protein [Trichuris trichiura]|uniref:Hexosyltransferase n=1 Tax=Trichuris trichiura TaxID=36087 RepID=A0A077ZDH7_TRITR|nr:Galactosyl T domain containing protein [Trichuris trichiura]